MRIVTLYSEDLMKFVIKHKQIDLSPRQKQIIKILSNEKMSFMMSSQDLAEVLKKSVRTIQKDLKLLTDFNLIVENIITNRKRYFRLNIKL